MEDVQEQTSYIYTILVFVLSAVCITCIIGLFLLVIRQIGKEKFLDVESTNGKLIDFTDAWDTVLCHFMVETETKKQYKRKRKPVFREDDNLELHVDYVDLIDFDDNVVFNKGIEVIELQDDMINMVEFNIELPEETEQAFCQVSRNWRCGTGNFEMDPNLMYTKEYDLLSLTCEKQREPNSGKNGNKIIGHLLVHGQTGKVDVEQEKNTRVFCYSHAFDHVNNSYSILDSSEVDSSFSLKHENINDSLHVSNKVNTWNISPDWIDQDVVVNDIVCHFANTGQEPENNSESGENSKGCEAMVCRTTDSQEVAVLLECTEEVENLKKVKPQKRQKNHRSGRRRRNRRRAQRFLRDIINWQISPRRNTSVLRLYDVQPGTTNGRIELHHIAHSSSNESDQNSEDSRGAGNGFVTEALPLNAGQRKPSIERDHLHANGVKESLEVPMGYQNGLLDYKSAQIADNKSSGATEEGGKENGASHILPPQSDTASNGFSLTTTDTLSSFFNSVSLFSVGEDEDFSFEWIRLKTFSDWPLNSMFSTVLARNGWVSLEDGDKARCYSCHVVHEGWRIGDDPDQYHSPNCRFKSGQSNNAPISRAATSNQTSTLGQISQYHQQFSFPENTLYPGNMSIVASSGGHPGPVLGVSEQALSRPQQDSIQPRNSNLGPQENYLLPMGNFPQPQEIHPQPQEMRETNTDARTGDLNVAPIQQLSAGLPTSEVLTAPTPTPRNNPTPRNTDSTRNIPTPRNTDSTRNTGTPTPQVPTDNLQSTAAAEAPPPNSKEAQLEALKRDPMGINFDRPKYPSYAILAVRISSYTDWPAAMTQKPRDMALAGFFYAGYGDYTRCFFCGGGLRNWEAGDDPWVEHARWFMKCAFVRQNRGQEFIDLVQKRAAELDEQGNQEGMGNSQTNPAISDPNSAEAKEEKVMRSPAVTTIKEMGYSEDKIKAAIRTIKSRLPRGKHKVSAQEILEVIFELNQLESRTPVDQSERVSDNPTNSTNQSDSVAENTGYNTSQSDPAPVGNKNSAVDASNADQSSLDDHEKRNSLPNPIFDELTSLKQENTSLKDQIMCKICMEKNVSIAFLPCGHLACCEDCAPAMRKCPFCREFVRGTVKTFLV